METSKHAIFWLFVVGLAGLWMHNPAFVWFGMGSAMFLSVYDVGYKEGYKVGREEDNE